VSVNDEPNDYVVRTHSGPRGWEVQILDPDGQAVWSRPCADESEARTFASTVKQHIYWLSPSKFREYYRLAEPA
jgi:hypothetical protein